MRVKGACPLAVLAPRVGVSLPLDSNGASVSCIKITQPKSPPTGHLTLVRQLHGFCLIDLFEFPPHTAAFVLLRFNFDFDPRFWILLAFYIHSSITGTRQSSHFPLPFFPS
jgi:hypothetical protein